MRNQFKALALLAAVATIPSVSLAERLITCPIGGIKTRVPEPTFNCIAAITMQLRLDLGCSFRDEVLPLCKSADFPIYKDFLVNDVAGLKKLVKTKEYKELLGEPRFLRANFVEKTLGTYSEEDYFNLLRSGYVYEPHLSYGNPKYFEAYREAANAYLKVASDEEKQYIYLFSAFIRLHTDEPEKARPLIEAARKYDPRVHWYSDNFVNLHTYANLLEACIPNPSAEECQRGHYIHQELSDES